MSITGAQTIVKSLLAREVDFIFGMPGMHNLELVDALIDSKINNVLVSSENCAVFMADGYARVTGKVGVCLAIPGPGITNMVTGLAEAFLDSSPIVIFVMTAAKDEHAFHIHEISQLDTVKPVVKGTFQIHDGAEISEIISRAFALACCEEPGPVVVEVLSSLLKSKTDYPSSCSSKPETGTLADVKPQIKKIVDMLVQAKQCGIYAGKGAQFSSVKVRELAEHLSAPVATTISGKGVIAEDHGLSVGFGFGPVGLKIAAKLFQTCDVVLALGVKFSEMSTGKWSMSIPGKLIHIDRSPHNLNRNYKTTIALCQDVETALDEILSQLKNIDKRCNFDMLEEIKKHKKEHLKKIKARSFEKGIHPSYFFYRLGGALGKNAIVVTDCGAHQLWAATDYCAMEPNSFLSPSDYQAMGFGIPAAIGASLGNPGKCTVCVCGDGGFLITGFELLTAVRNNLNLAVVVFNDGELGLIAGTQRRVYARTHCVTLANPDFRQLAAAFHVDYMKVTNERQLNDGLERIKRNIGVVMLDVQIDYKEWPGYMRGAAKAAWQQLSLSQKLNLVAGRAFRLIKQSGRLHQPRKGASR